MEAIQQENHWQRTYNKELQKLINSCMQELANVTDSSQRQQIVHKHSKRWKDKCVQSKNRREPINLDMEAFEKEMGRIGTQMKNREMLTGNVRHAALEYIGIKNYYADKLEARYRCNEIEVILQHHNGTVKVKRAHGREILVQSSAYSMEHLMALLKGLLVSETTTYMASAKPTLINLFMNRLRRLKAKAQ